jgi:anti-anti-sigma regulatory factor
VVIREGDVVTSLSTAGSIGVVHSDSVPVSSRRLAVDVSALTSVDSPGLAGLLRVRHAVIDAGVAFGLSGALPALRQVAELAGFEALLPDE